MKNRVAYSKKHREQAKQEKKGLITVSYVTPDGFTVTLQSVPNEKKQKYVENALHELLGME